MSTRGLLLIVLVLLGLRVLAFVAHEHPRGDVMLDVGVARQLASGDGYRSGFERGVVRVAGADTPVPAQTHADQHPPLWPTLGAAISVLGATPFAALKLAGLLASLLLLPLLLRSADRLLEGLLGADDRLPVWLMALVGASFVMVDSGGNGSLYAAQALGMLLLVELLAAPRPSLWATGLVIGLLVQLNHQCLVLLPLPVLIALCCAPRGQRVAFLVRAGGAVCVALLVQLPWWLRNAALFDDPFFSVNGLYLLYRAGVPPFFAVESGLPVVRLVGELSPASLPGVFLGNLRQNLPWFAAAAPLASAGLLLPAMAGVPSLLLDARRRADPRVLALMFSVALLGAAALLWPATKLRYLIPLVPLISLLGLRVLASKPSALTRLCARALSLAWLAMLALTADDITDTGVDAHPERWFALAGATLLVLIAAWARPAARRSGLAVAALLVALGLSASVAAPALSDAAEARPATAYHSTGFLPDVFGADAELAEERRADALRQVADAALADTALADPALGQLADPARAATRPQPARVLGPLDLLARPDVELIELPTGQPADWFLATLEAWLPGRRAQAAWHVVLNAEQLEQLPDALRARLEPAPRGAAGEWSWFRLLGG
ncbi:MAG: hypothetical protein DHS20C15_11180 [Planctomycetota bacterium]|nr:MAG: hypothetical protein DHS20C15_11180 [Planctomycetota bacterium]